jgi:hypothetical protein
MYRSIIYKDGKFFSPVKKAVLDTDRKCIFQLVFILSWMNLDGGGVEQDSRTSFPVARQRQTNGRTDRLKFLESGYPRENENWKVVKEEEEEYCNN